MAGAASADCHRTEEEMIMRTRALVSIFLVIATAYAFAGKEEGVQELVEKAESARVEDRPGLYLRAADLRLKAADDLYTQGKSEDAKLAVKDVVNYCQKAVDAATKSHKKLKNAEISIRKMAARLSDVKRTLSFEDQGPVQDAIDRLQHLRSELLSSMFGSSKEKE